MNLVKKKGGACCKLCEEVMVGNLSLLGRKE